MLQKSPGKSQHVFRAAQKEDHVLRCDKGDSLDSFGKGPKQPDCLRSAALGSTPGCCPPRSLAADGQCRRASRACLARLTPAGWQPGIPRVAASVDGHIWTATQMSPDVSSPLLYPGHCLRPEHRAHFPSLFSFLRLPVVLCHLPRPLWRDCHFCHLAASVLDKPLNMLPDLLA